IALGWSYWKEALNPAAMGTAFFCSTCETTVKVKGVTRRLESSRAWMWVPHRSSSKKGLRTANKCYGASRWGRPARCWLRNDVRDSQQLYPTVPSFRFEKPSDTISNCFFTCRHFRFRTLLLPWRNFELVLTLMMVTSKQPFVRLRPQSCLLPVGRIGACPPRWRKDC